MEITLREMIRRSVEDSERWRGGLGYGVAEWSASGTTPERANRPVDQPQPAARGQALKDNGICRLIGFVPLPRRC